LHVRSSLEVQPGFACAVREGSHPSGVEVSAAVENDLAHALGLGARADEFSNERGLFDLALALELALISASSVEAATKVFPFVSSITCA